MPEINGGCGSKTLADEEETEEEYPLPNMISNASENCRGTICETNEQPRLNWAALISLAAAAAAAAAVAPCSFGLFAKISINL